MGRALRLRALAAGLALGVTALGSSAGVPSHARPAPAAPALAGKNVVTANRTSVTAVRVPRDTSLSIAGFGTARFGPRDAEDGFHAHNPDVSISGAGRVTGIALVEVGVRPWDGRAALLAVNLDFCGEPGCRSEEGPYLKTSGFLPAENERYPIPAGDYLLYTITDGAPVTVELTLDGLRGRTRIRPGRPAPEVSVGAPPETLWDSSAGAGAAYGETYADAGDEAIMLTAFRVRSDVSATSRYGVCLYEGEPATPAPVAYAYPCAGGFGVYVGGPASVGPYQVLFHQAVHTIADGGATWSFGGGYVSPPPPTEFEHVQLHLPLPPGVVETSGVPARGSCGAAGRHFAAGVCVRLPHATGTVSTR